MKIERKNLFSISFIIFLVIEIILITLGYFFPDSNYISIALILVGALILIFFLWAIGLILKTVGQLLSQLTLKGVIEWIKETAMIFFGLIKALGGFLLIIVGIILVGIITAYIFNRIGLIPFLIIVLIIVVVYRFERIEEELRGLRERREDKYDDYDKFE